MKIKVKEHAKDYLLEYKAKKDTPNWLALLIQKVIDNNGIIYDDDKNIVYQELLKENNINTEQNVTGMKNEDNMALEEIEINIPAQNLILQKITHIKGVNALMPNQSITFSPACTVIYGLNGTGKSGYFRIIHELAGGIKSKEILGNIHSPDDDLEVDVVFSLDNKKQDSFKWKDKTSRGIAPFNQIKVFDTEYLPIFLKERENLVNIEPLGLSYFQIITTIVDEFKERLDQVKQQKQNSLPDLQILIDVIHSDNLKLLLEKTSLEEQEKQLIDDNKLFTTEDAIKLEQLKKDKSILEKNTNEDRKKVLNQEKKEIDSLKEYLLDLKSDLEKLTKNISSAISDYLEKKKARDERAKEFEILKKIPSRNTEEWQDFIKSAKVYGETINNSVLNKGEKCIYCHQPLSKDAIKLVQAYAQYLDDQSQQNFENAKDSISELSIAIQNLETDFKFSESLETILANLYNEQKQDHKTFVEQGIDEAKKQKKILEKAIKDKTTVSGIFTLDLLRVDEKLEELSVRKQKEMNNLLQSDTQKEQRISELESKINKLKDKQNISKWKTKIESYFEYSKQIESYETISFTNIKSEISKLSTSAHNNLLTKKLTIDFRNELKQLGKDSLPVELNKTKTTDGKFYTQLQVSKRSVSSILSEGEQKAVGLALFLTEVENSNGNKAPVVFDDPVNSLDHEIRNSLAKRLICLSKKRQIVIFTHDLLFTSQLVKQASDAEIENVITHVIDVSSVGIGRVNKDSAPKMSNLANLKVKYSDSIKNFDSKTHEEKERSLANAFDYLRCACECTIEELLFAGTIERYSDHVKVQNLEEAVFDQELAQEIVELHGEISEKAMMHNRSDYQNQSSVKLDDYNAIKAKFESLEKSLRDRKKNNRKAREKKRKTKKMDPLQNW
jgi:hypothetical protein